jgi:hypothetical protein
MRLHVGDSKSPDGTRCNCDRFLVDAVDVAITFVVTQLKAKIQDSLNDIVSVMIANLCLLLV